MRIPLWYKIGSVILSIVAYILMIGAFLNIINVGAHPMIIFSFLVTLAVVIYATLSFKLTHIVNNQLSLKRKTKDWINVNAYVGLVFCVFMTLGCINFLSSPALVNTILETLPNKIADMPDVHFFKNILHTIVIVFLIYVLLLSIHIIAGLIFVRRYAKLSQTS